MGIGQIRCQARLLFPLLMVCAQGRLGIRRRDVAAEDDLAATTAVAQFDAAAVSAAMVVFVFVFMFSPP